MDVIIHIGYPKSASTTLQKCLFARHKDITSLAIYPSGNIGRDSNTPIPAELAFAKDSRIKELYAQLVNPDGIVYDPEYVKQLWEGIHIDYKVPGLPIILSNERFLSSRFSNPEIIMKALRLYELIPLAKILIIIRSQLALLKSLYRDHPFDPRTMEYRKKPVSFSKWLKIDLNRTNFSHSNTLYFNRLTAIYDQHFGKEKVLVLPLEMLSFHKEDFVTRLSDFIGIDYEQTYQLIGEEKANQGISQTANTYRMLRNAILPLLKNARCYKDTMRKVDQGILSLTRNLGKTADYKATDQDLEMLKEKYAAGNSELMLSRDLPLKELGYFTL